MRKTYDPAPASDRARAERIMQHLADEGPDDLNNQQFKLEGRYPAKKKGASRIPVYAIKSYQIRLYGGWIDNGREFRCVECEIKQQKKANKKQLERVAEKLGELDEQ